jgi:hypothetical protein
MDGPADGAGVRSDSGIMEVPPQYEHFIVSVPTSGSSGAPHVGHLKARTESFFAILLSSLHV